MATATQQESALADSLHKRRPPFKSYLKSDANTYRDDVKLIEEKRLVRQMKFPSLLGKGDVDSFKDPQKPTSPGFIKFNDEGDYRAPAPYRSCDNIIDPVSGFVSVAGDQDRNTGHTNIKSMVQLPFSPQSTTPQSQNSIRPIDSAPPHLRRQCENEPGGASAWNGRKVSDAQLRSSLGGWTSEKDPRAVEVDNFGKPRTPADDNRNVRDKLALKFMYTSSTQRGYEEVPWDSALKSPRKWPPTTTLEEKPDMISQVFSNKRYAALPMEWQTVGRSWDATQTRRGYYKQNIPIPGIVFCSPCPRAQQIPLYSGCVGGENLVEIDNPDESFTPFTAKRVLIPRPTDTSHRPNIPNYAGCSWYRPDSIPAHANNSEMPGTPTTARVHRPMYVTPNDSQHKRESKMSKMVTTVPPGNPFNKISKEPVIAQ